jgi:hypothetical protein
VDLARAAALGFLVIVFSTQAEKAHAAEEKTVDEVIECQLKTRPLTNTVRRIEIERTDRIGGVRSYKAKVFGGVSREGFRTLLIQVTRPPELLDFSFMIVEREGANHMFVSPSGLPQVKLVRGAARGSSLFGTDLSYEDVERLYGLARPGETHALVGGDGMLDGRPVWQLETAPAAESGSAYWKIVSQVDRETCVLLRAEMYESAGEPRKVLTADPESIRREGKVWVAHDVLVRDLRDETETRMRVDEIQLQAKNEDVPFTPEELEKYKRSQKSVAP